MALVKFGGGVSEMRGKEGGVIYSRNAYGSYIKQKVSPVNPQTGFQQTQRQQMGNIAQAWAGLSAGVKDSWDSLGAQVTRVNRFGDSTYYTGFALFMRLNRNLVLMGGSIITTSPTPPSIPPLTLSAPTIDISDTALEVAYSPTVPTGYQMLVYTTPSIVTGRRFVKNFYRYLTFQIANGASPFDVWANFITQYGVAPQLGAKIYIKAKLVHIATGFDGVAQVISGTVVA